MDTIELKEKREKRLQVMENQLSKMGTQLARLEAYFAQNEENKKGEGR